MSDKKTTAELINEIVALILSGGAVVMDFYLKIEPLLNLGPDEKQNIANAVAASNAADEDTIAFVKAWNEAHPQT
jgi:hypothetical protein